MALVYHIARFKTRSRMCACIYAVCYCEQHIAMCMAFEFKLRVCKHSHACFTLTNQRFTIAHTHTVLSSCPFLSSYSLVNMVNNVMKNEFVFQCCKKMIFYYFISCFFFFSWKYNSLISGKFKFLDVEMASQAMYGIISIDFSFRPSICMCPCRFYHVPSILFR